MCRKLQSLTPTDLISTDRQLDNNGSILGGLFRSSTSGVGGDEGQSIIYILIMGLRFILFTILSVSSAIVIEFADLTFVTTEIGWWFIAIAIFGFVVVVERRPVSSLGLQAASFETVWTAAIGLMLAVLLVATSTLLAGLVGVDFTESRDRMGGGSLPPISLVGIAILRAGVVEELLFRGLLISRCLELRVGPIQAVLLSTAVFVAPHAFFWPGPHLLLVASAGVAFGTIFVWKRDLVACIIAHVGFNIIGYALSAL